MSIFSHKVFRNLLVESSVKFVPSLVSIKYWLAQKSTKTHKESDDLIPKPDRRSLCAKKMLLLVRAALPFDMLVSDSKPCSGGARLATRQLNARHEPVDPYHLSFIKTSHQSTAKRPCVNAWFIGTVLIWPLGYVSFLFYVRLYPLRSPLKTSAPPWEGTLRTFERLAGFLITIPFKILKIKVKRLSAKNAQPGKPPARHTFASKDLRFMPGLPFHFASLADQGRTVLTGWLARSRGV